MDMIENDECVREGREWYGYEGLAASGLDAVFENFLDGTAAITSKGSWKWTDVIHDLGMHLADVAHQSTGSSAAPSTTSWRHIGVAGSRWCRAWRARR